MFRKQKNNTVVSIYEPVEFPVENHEAIALDLDVVNLAKQQARLNRPSLLDEDLDVNEHNIKSYFKTKCTQAVHKVDQSISSLKDEICGISISKELTNADQVATEFSKEVAAELTPKLNDLEALRHECVQAGDDLNSFKKENGIKRSANYPHSHWMTVSILLIALIVESVLNGTFFAEGSDTGLIGGVATALVIALVNIGGGFLLGWWVLRYKNHCKQWLSLTMSGLFAFLLFVPIVFNLMVAHYRSALIADPDDAAQLAMDSFTGGILSISDVNSWLLFAIGLLFCFLAIYKGYGVDDPYPGFGKVARKKEQLEDELMEEREHAFRHLEDLHQIFLNVLDKDYEDVERKSKTVRNLSTVFDQQKRLLDSYIKHLEDTQYSIIKLYRETNMGNREDGTPKSFQMWFDPCLGYEGLDIEYKDKQEEISSAKDELATKLPEIRTSMLQLKDEYHNKINGACRV